ncbi:PPOX class F420-dependent oxidoreductase [Streptomyces sulphureus]|uniref:PPOX class F420-dependent oxidoreductase n=1 Tax=Streptomyces sulphureus TaxID=47758 RepID=UPI0003826E2F|nr:PPOX class F420-dependent oxidoreductase [Streptomyces sulphureus]
MAEEDAPERLLALLGEHRIGVLVTVKRDGRPQLSNVIHHWDPDRRTLRVSITATRAKSRNLARDPRASYYVGSPDGWRYVVAEGEAEVTAPAAEPHDATVEELVELYRALSGEHPDWDEYRAAMVAEQRQVATVHVTRAYGQAG